MAGQAGVVAGDAVAYPRGMSHQLLVVVAVIVAVAGASVLTPATQGVGVVCLACLVAILARIKQAGAHQEELLKRMGGPGP